MRRGRVLAALAVAVLGALPCQVSGFWLLVSGSGRAAYGQTSNQQPVTRNPLRVLFIGNSFTYVNDLPRIVEAMSRADGGPKIDWRMVAFPGFSLEDHWRQGGARREIASGPWDFVVLQQGPSSTDDGREVLVEYARRFAPLIKKAGATPAFYGVWPASVRTQDFPGAEESYRQAARVVQGVVLPAAEAWERVFRRDQSVALYGPDGLHPSPEGSYLAALVVYSGLTGRPVASMPATLSLGTDGKLEIPESDAAVLREAAAVR
jgi:hypothetical protein